MRKLTCPGSHQPPNPPVCLPGDGPLRSFCGYCGGEYVLTASGRVRRHSARDVEVQTRHRCPACHRDVQPTKLHHLIPGHADTAGNSCSAAGYPFRIAEAVDSIQPRRTA